MECQSAFIIFTLVISFTITRSEISSIPNSPDRVLLSLPSGDSLIGLEATTANGRQFHAFLGVPYAQPPVEALRFERPLPYSAGGIGKVHDCTVEKPSCSHYVLKTHKAPGCGIIDSIKRLRKQLKERKAEKKRRKRPQTTTTNAPPVTLNTTPFAPFLPTKSSNLELMDRFGTSGFQRYQDNHHHHHHHHHGPVNDTDSDIIRIKTRVHVVDEDYYDDDYEDYDDNDLENEENEEFVEEIQTTTAPTTRTHTHRHQNDPRIQRLETLHHHQDSPQRIHLVTRIRQQDGKQTEGPRHNHNNANMQRLRHGENRRQDGPQHIHLITRIHQQDPSGPRTGNLMNKLRTHLHDNERYGEEVLELERPTPSGNRGTQRAHEPRWRERVVESQYPNQETPTNRFGKHHTHDGDIRKEMEQLQKEEIHHRHHPHHDREEVAQYQSPVKPTNRFGSWKEVEKLEKEEVHHRYHPHSHDREEIIEVQKPRDEKGHRHHPHSHEDREEVIEVIEPRTRRPERLRAKDSHEESEEVVERPNNRGSSRNEEREGKVVIRTKVKSGNFEEDPDTVVLIDEDGVVTCEAGSGKNKTSSKNGKVEVCCETYDNEELNLKNGTRCRPRRRSQRTPRQTQPTLEEDACGHAHGSEDCLYLNVYAPVFNDDEIPRQLPILVYVPASPASVSDHREFTSLGIHGADRLLEQGIIVVVVTGRRTGALGYLCPPSGPAGNQAAADVLAALRWTHQNAVSLNGDPNRITAWGDGDGAALVHLTQIHQDIQLPFTSVILTSGGTALAPWAAAHKPAATFRYLALKHLAILADDRKRLEKLKRASHQKLQKYAAWIEYEKQLLGPGPWATGSAFASCVEHPAPRAPTDSIIPTYSHEKVFLGRAANVPMLIIHPDRKMYQLPSKKFKFWFGLRAVLKPKKLVPEDMHVESKELKTVASKIRHHYLLHRTTRKLKEAYLNYLVDSLYIRPTLKTAVLQARISKVWLARISEPPPQSDATASAHLLPPGRASFGIIRRVLGQNAPAGDAVSVAIANFVNRNDPGWLPVQANSSNQLACLNIGSSSNPYQQIDYQHPDLHHLTFWDRLYDTYGYRPFNTY